jgi:hypothetical protein
MPLFPSGCVNTASIILTELYGLRIRVSRVAALGRMLLKYRSMDKIILDHVNSHIRDFKEKNRK